MANEIVRLLRQDYAAGDRNARSTDGGFQHIAANAGNDLPFVKVFFTSPAFICDGCVGICNKILEATPADFAGWDAMTDERLLTALKAADATVEATRSVLQAQIDELRKRDVSWQAIGAALGISRQAAWERFS